MDFLYQGTPASPAQILERREERARHLEELSALNPDAVLICCKLNIPGSIKQSPILEQLFERAMAEITAAVRQATLLDRLRTVTGPEAIFAAPSSPEQIKRRMVALEEDSAVGRLYDIDVMHQGKALTREALGLPERACFICALPARLCARSQAHARAEVLKAIERLLRTDPELARRLDELKDQRRI